MSIEVGAKLSGKVSGITDLTVAKYVASKNGKVKSFVRYEVGEGIEKKEENFAEEVMSQIK